MLYAGDGRAALAIARRLEAKGQGSDPAIGHIYVEVGFTLGDEALIRHGMDLAGRYLRRAEAGDAAALAHSVLGNGHLGLFGLKYATPPANAAFLGPELDQAKNQFRAALAAGPGDDSLRAGILANLGDCYDHLGRAIEALECYEEALAYQPDHALALANKALGFLSYSRLAGEHRGTFLIEAYWLLARALEAGVGAQSEPVLRDYLQQIGDLFAGTPLLESPPAYAGCSVAAVQPLERYATEFCLQHRLYLSICTFCQRCDAAIGDSAIIRGLAPIAAAAPPAGEEDRLRLCEHLNQVKQDFVAARFMLILAEAEQIDLSFADAGVAMVDTQGISLHGVRTELLKGSFKAFYGVLDKIASFLNEYLQLGAEETRADFRRIWYADWKAKAVHPALGESENLSLGALFDIHRDFETGPYEGLRLLRNVLTHGFVNVGAAGQGDGRLTRDDLLAKTLSLSAIVRNAVIYLIGFVDDEANRGAAVPEGAVPRTVAQ
jgi:tetratricopeptide (TPR) repeat protein